MAGSPTPSESAAAALKKGKHLTAEELQARRDSALAQAKEAEDEAATATTDRDVAANRARDALKHAAAARAEAALGNPNTLKDDAPDDLKDDAPDASNRGHPDHDLHQAMLLHEAATVVNLHHHATGIQNIRNLVHVILDLTDDNYKRWRDQLLLIVGKYSLEDHILQDTAAPNFPDWRRMDCVVKSWISGTISTEVPVQCSQGVPNALFLIK
jgi:hypothetical protein